jgi:hypothetical protein
MNSPSPTNVAASPGKEAITPTEKCLLWLVRDLVLQSCTDFPKDALHTHPFDDSTPVFSGFIAVHAEAIALLAEYGLVANVTDNGGRVVGGTMLNLVDSAQVLKTGPFAPKDEKAVSRPRVLESEQ